MPLNSKEKDQDGVYHDLDYLAGTWTEEDDREFLQAAEDFNKIDEELWQQNMGTVSHDNELSPGDDEKK